MDIKLMAELAKVTRILRHAYEQNDEHKIMFAGGIHRMLCEEHVEYMLTND